MRVGEGKVKEGKGEERRDSKESSGGPPEVRDVGLLTSQEEKTMGQGVKRQPLKRD